MSSCRSCRFHLVLAGACLSAGLWGCGKAPVDVSGTITIAGKAPNLKGIEIVFLAGDGKLRIFPVTEAGRYTASGVPIGEAKVGFIYIPPDIKGKKKMRFPKLGQEKETDKQKPFNPIPESLWEPTKSALTFKVESGKENVFDFDIKPK